jgi:hypothetical protein
MKRKVVFTRTPLMIDQNNAPATRTPATLATRRGRKRLAAAAKKRKTSRNSRASPSRIANAARATNAAPYA